MAIENILVLTDFTQAAATTLENAYILATANRAKLEVAHMVADKAEKHWAIKKIHAQCSELENYNLNVTVEPIAFEGSKYADIINYLEGAKPELVMMPTHGKKDIQLILGSFAMKIISATEVPFLVYQQDSPLTVFNNILVPVFANESITKESIEPVVNLAKVCNSTVRVIAPTYDTDSDLRSLEAAIIKTNQFLEEEDVAHSTHKSMSNYAKYKDVILLEAQRHSSDLIVLLSGRDAKTAKVIQPKGLHQAMITNKLHVPVLCI